MTPGWNDLPDPLQLLVAQRAMRRAACTIAGQAEQLAGAIEDGGLRGLDGPEALRLLAVLIRLAAQDPLAPCGRA